MGVEGLSKKEKGLMDMDDSVVITGGWGEGGEGVEGLSKKEKGPMDLDNSVVIAGEEGMVM